jgi:hypothetical protein
MPQTTTWNNRQGTRTNTSCCSGYPKQLEYCIAKLLALAQTTTSRQLFIRTAQKQNPRTIQTIPNLMTLELMTNISQSLMLTFSDTVRPHLMRFDFPNVTIFVRIVVGLLSLNLVSLFGAAHFYPIFSATRHLILQTAGKICTKPGIFYLNCESRGTRFSTSPLKSKRIWADSRVSPESFSNSTNNLNTKRLLRNRPKIAIFSISCSQFRHPSNGP